MQGCLACEHGINVSLVRKHTFDCILLPSLLTDSLWTVKFDADGRVLKRHEHEDDVDHREFKRVPIQLANILTGDTVVKCAKLFDTPPSSSSSHEVAPNLHGSLSEDEDPATREHAVKKYRADADMEISAIEVLTNVKLEVDRALDTANQTLHRLLGEIPLESEVVTKAAKTQQHQRRASLH